MIILSQRHRQIRPEEEGYMLVWVIFMLFLVILALSVAAPRVRVDIQRQRDLETMRRGQQYIRAIQLYYRKFGSYPPNIDALVKTSEIRFLRKRYLDPTTGKDDWKPVGVGQNKTPIMGFFGQPLAGATGGIGGVGPGSVNGATPASSAFGSSDASAGSALGQSGASPGTSSGSGFSLGSGIGGASSGSTLGGGSTPGTSSPGGLGSTAGGSTSSPAGGGGLTGQTFGGAGIMGVSPASPKASVYVYKKKDHYKDWEFLYSPMLDQMMSGGNQGTIGQPASGMSGGLGSPGTGTGTGIGAGSGTGTQSGGFSLGIGGSSPTSPTSPAPQQPAAPSP